MSFEPLTQMREMHLFAGIGGGILGGMLLNHHPVCAVEIDAYCMSVLRQRIADGVLPDMHLHDDIRTFDGAQWKGKVDVVAGGFPCQDLSISWKGDGLNGKRSGLFFELLRVVREVEPEFVFLENVPTLVNRGLDTILGEMASLGFDAAWQVLSAAGCGASHDRKRIWILAHANRAGLGEHGGTSTAPQEHDPSECSSDVSRRNYSACTQRQRCQKPFLPLGWRPVTGWHECDHDTEECPCGFDYASECLCPGPTEDGIEYGQLDQVLYGRRSIDWWQTEPNLDRLVDGFPGRVAQLRALGNAQVPIVAAAAWRTLERMLGD